MNILEKLNKVNATQAALEQKKKVLSDEITALQQELVSVYGENWEDQYNVEVKKLEAFDESCSA